MGLEEKIKESSKYNSNYNKIKGNIDFDKYTEKESFFSKFTLFIKENKGALTLTCILLIMVSFIFMMPTGDTKGEPNFPPDGEPNNPSYEVSHSLAHNEASLIGIAAYYEFDKKGVSNLSNLFFNINSNSSKVYSLSEDDSDEEYLKVSYPYDYVKINSAYKFSVNITSINDRASEEIISNSCGLGELEVVVAEFETYIEDDGVRMPSVSDTLISLRGYNGYYTILANSGHRENSDFMHIFSSHKRLLEDEVSKDFTPPILSIFLEEKSNNERYIYFETSNDLLSFGSYKKDYAFKNITEIEYVSRSSMYSVFELAKLPTKEITVSIVEIDFEKKCIEVASETNLEYIYYASYTEGVEITELNIGDIIKIEYDFLFETYDPTNVYINSIIVLESSVAEVD